MCETYLRKAEANIIVINNLLDTYEAANDTIGRISLEYSGFTYFIPLSEIQNILSQHPLYTHTKKASDQTCAEVGKIVCNIPKRDVDYISQFIKFSRAALQGITH